MVTVQRVCKLSSVPTNRQLESWADLVLGTLAQDLELLIRIVDVFEITQLNTRYRNQKEATNILAFEFESFGDFESNFLGDLVICGPLVKQEALAQQKKVSAHWAHLVIHGTLHLLGYDHLRAEDTKKMQRLEVAFLKKIGIADPYIC